MLHQIQEQAALTMPIMAPLADLVGVSRQVAVLAYQLGSGFHGCFYARIS